MLSAGQCLQELLLLYGIYRNLICSLVWSKQKKSLKDNASDSGSEGDDATERTSESKYATRQVFSQNEEADLLCYGLTYELCREWDFECSIEKLGDEGKCEH
ncbi:hypothetical protein JTB14_034341 [Gonioctena quinquepunctata]|nr:hypothetical protein JTB14_034341 [Gonioctena quinquepunctata]